MRNVPNILSAFRILLAPVFAIAYFSHAQNPQIIALIVYGVASLTDVLDGYIARKYDITSELGRVLDPLGDKLMVCTVLACITVDGIIPLWAIILFVCKELLMLAGGLVIHNVAKVDMPSSNFIGKASTVVFFVVCSILMVFRSIPANIAEFMIAIALGLTFMALGSYVLSFTAVMKERKEHKNP